MARIPAALWDAFEQLLPTFPLRNAQRKERIPERSMRADVWALERQFGDQQLDERRELLRNGLGLIGEADPGAILVVLGRARYDAIAAEDRDHAIDFLREADEFRQKARRALTHAVHCIQEFHHFLGYHSLNPDLGPYKAALAALKVDEFLRADNPYPPVPAKLRRPRRGVKKAPWLSEARKALKAHGVRADVQTMLLCAVGLLPVSRLSR